MRRTTRARVRGLLSVPAASALVALAVFAVVPAGAAAQTRKIVIDPGHGGGDPGGTGNGLQEKEVVLDVGLRFKQLLDADTGDPGGGGDWIALSTREDDTFVPLSARAAFANAEGADRFMSIHSNAFATADANGTETYSFSEGSTGAELRNLVQAEMIAAWGLTDRGNKTANFAVLRETAMPAELHELGFITNAGDAAFLASPEERQRAAEAHLRAIQRHFGIDPYVPSLEGTGELVGRVIGDGGPVAGAIVRVDGGPEQVTPEDGSFAFALVPAGPHELSASAEGYQDAAIEVELGAGKRGEHEIVLTRADTGGGDADLGADGDDGAGEEEDAAGCGCRAHRSDSGAGDLLAFVVAAVALWRRRRWHPHKS
jgi:N-acetylmuramoyl-L-alanine amidase